MAIDLEPQSREEMYLASIDQGGKGTIPATPQSRKEMYLESINEEIKNVGGGEIEPGAGKNSLKSKNALSAKGEGDVVIGYQATATGNSYNCAVYGPGATANNGSATAIGRIAKGYGSSSVALGYNSLASADYSSALGNSSASYNRYSVALGTYASTTRDGEINVGTGNYSYGYNKTKLRVIGGVHDPINDTDAATKAYVDAAIAALKTELGL